MFVAIWLVGECAGRAIFHAALRVCKIATAIFAQGIQRAITEHTVKIIYRSAAVARKIRTILVLEESLIAHLCNLAFDFITAIISHC